MRSNGDKKKRLCSYGCGRLAAPQRPQCYNCKSKAWREKNPIAFLYHNLKKSAKKRKYAFTITLEYFTEFIKDSGYLEKRGRAADSLTIDRIKNWEGYIPGNLKVMPKGANTAKFHEERRQLKKELETENIYIDNGDTDLPF